MSSDDTSRGQQQSIHERWQCEFSPRADMEMETNRKNGTREHSKRNGEREREWGGGGGGLVSIDPPPTPHPLFPSRRYSSNANIACDHEQDEKRYSSNSASAVPYCGKEGQRCFGLRCLFDLDGRNRAAG